MWGFQKRAPTKKGSGRYPSNFFEIVIERVVQSYGYGEEARKYYAVVALVC